MVFQQIVFSFREEARITRCHKQYSTTTFLLTLKINSWHILQDIPKKCDHQIARQLPHTRKTVEKSVLARKTATCRIVLMRTYR